MSTRNPTGSRLNRPHLSFFVPLPPLVQDAVTKMGQYIAALPEESPEAQGSRRVYRELDQAVGWAVSDWLDSIAVWESAGSIWVSLCGHVTRHNVTDGAVMAEWPLADFRELIPENERDLFDPMRFFPIGLLDDMRVLFSLHGYPRSDESYWMVPVIFDPRQGAVPWTTLHAADAKVTRPKGLTRSTLRQAHQSENFVLCEIVDIAAMFHVDADIDQEFFFLLDLAARQWVRLPLNKEPKLGPPCPQVVLASRISLVRGDMGLAQGRLQWSLTEAGQLQGQLYYADNAVEETYRFPIEGDFAKATKFAKPVMRGARNGQSVVVADILNLDQGLRISRWLLPDLEQ